MKHHLENLYLKFHMHVGTFNLLHVDIDLKQNCFKATVNTKHFLLHIIMYFFSELQWYLKKNKQTDNLVTEKTS